MVAEDQIRLVIQTFKDRLFAELFPGRTIYLIRDEKVMLDRDLAELYQVQTKALNQAVRRNLDRFPTDFMFQISEKEVVDLNRSQFVTGSQKHRDPRSRPYAFTEQGVAMLSSVLRSKRRSPSISKSCGPL